MSAWVRRMCPYSPPCIQCLEAARQSEVEMDKGKHVRMNMAAELQIGPDMIEQAMREFEAENPGRKAEEMTATEFADRMMRKITATARPTDAPRS